VDRRADRACRMTAAIRVDVTVPVTMFGFGPFAFDALEQMIGTKLADLLAPLMVGPVSARPSAAGPAVEVYPLALPSGEGATIPLGAMGEVGVANDGGLIVAHGAVVDGVVGGAARRGALVRGPEPALSLDGAARVAKLWVRLRPGMRATVPLGECGVKAG
jgi:hypothetical protein